MLAEENVFFSSLASSAPDEDIVPFEEPDIVELPPPLPKAPKVKGRAKNTATQATSHLPTFTFGLCNASATFQRLVMYIFTDLLFKSMTLFVDDFTLNLTVATTYSILERLSLDVEKCS